MGAALAALLSLAISIGVQHVADLIQRSRAKAQNVTPSQLTGWIGAIINKARTKSSQVLNKVLDKLNNLPTNFTGSSAVKDYVNELTRKYSDEAYQARKDINAVETELATREQQLNDYKYMSDTARIQSKADIEKLADKTRAASDQIDLLADKYNYGGVEDNVSK